MAKPTAVPEAAENIRLPNSLSNRIVSFERRALCFRRAERERRDVSEEDKGSSPVS